MIEQCHGKNDLLNFLTGAWKDVYSMKISSKASFLAMTIYTLIENEVTPSKCHYHSPASGGPDMLPKPLTMVTILKAFVRFSIPRYRTRIFVRYIVTMAEIHVVVMKFIWITISDKWMLFWNVVWLCWSILHFSSFLPINVYTRQIRPCHRAACILDLKFDHVVSILSGILMRIPQFCKVF